MSDGAEIRSGRKIAPETGGGGGSDATDGGTNNQYKQESAQAGWQAGRQAGRQATTAGTDSISAWCGVSTPSRDDVYLSPCWLTGITKEEPQQDTCFIQPPFVAKCLLFPQRTMEFSEFSLGDSAVLSEHS